MEKCEQASVDLAVSCFLLPGPGPLPVLSWSHRLGGMASQLPSSLPFLCEEREEGLESPFRSAFLQ